MTDSTTFLPTSLKRDDQDRLVIEWNDGHHSVYTWQHLRDNCPCANCREERLENQPPDPFRLLKPNELVPLKAVSMPRIGRYAYKIVWSDGHDTGLYTLDTLRALCQCEQCATSATN